MTSHTHWSAIVLTAANPVQAQVFRQELLLRQRRGLIPNETLCLSVPDPASVRVGSGGATLNALVAVSEYLSARAGRAFIDADTLQDAKILILHSGGDSRRIPQSSVCGKSFVSLPIVAEDGELLAPLDLLLQQLDRICALAPPGLFVASGDVMLTVPSNHFNWTRPGVTGLAIPAPREYGSRHGVYRLDAETQSVSEFFQKASQETLHEKGAVRPDGTVLLDCGVIYFCSQTTRTFLNCHIAPPLDACTYLGVDSGAPPVRYELYSDVLFCLAKQTKWETYLAEVRHDPQLLKIRTFLWNTIRGVPFHAVVAEDGQFLHLGTTRETVDFLFSDSPFRQAFNFVQHAQSFIERPSAVEHAVVVNSLLTGSGSAGQFAVIENSELRGNWSIGDRAFCSGIRSFPGLRVADRIVVQEVRLQNPGEGPPRKVLTVFGVDDNPKHHFTDPQATVANQSWSGVLERSAIEPDVIWPDIPETNRSLWTAKLFPVLHDKEWPEAILWLQDPEPPSVTALRRWRKAERVSFADILNQADLEGEWAWRRDIYFRIQEHKIETIIWERRDESLLPIFAGFARENRYQLFDLLDAIAAEASFETAGRVFACLADALAAFAKNQGGLRSGPARNENWRRGLDLMEAGDIPAAVKFMAETRARWLSGPEFLIRAARHYEAAAQIVIHHAVKTAAREPRPDTLPPVGTWVVAQAPARIDFAGGWTDTPPITYEGGGVVVNAAVRVDGMCPIRVEARRIEEPILELSAEKDDAPLRCHTLDDLRDFDHPLAPGALFKSAILCAGIVSLQSPLSLQEQLRMGGGGLQIRSAVHLPKGSGLGTSSILGGAMLAALAKTSGQGYGETELIHAVTELEQMMTTGGGWQDPAGGLLPGIKYLRAEPVLPLHVYHQCLEMPPGFGETLDRHLVLIDTGRTRLARNLLQDVIRRWYARIPEIVVLTKELVLNAERTREAVAAGDLERLGWCLERYWEQKQRMAEGVCPPHVTRLIETLRPLVYGLSLTGAGGGGFLVSIAREPADIESLKARVSKLTDSSGFNIHTATIDPVGLTLSTSS